MFLTKTGPLSALKPRPKSSVETKNGPNDGSCSRNNSDSEQFSKLCKSNWNVHESCSTSRRGLRAIINCP